MIAALALVAPVWAGGWAVVTLDELPAQVAANQPLTIGFMVRQHGRTPLDGLTPQITATRAGTNQSFSVTAQAQGRVGHYVATLTFPSAGMWNWSIDAFTFAQPMPALNVLAAAPAQNTSTGIPVSLPLAAGIAGLIGAAGALLMSLRARTRRAFAPILACALISVVGFASAASVTSGASAVSNASNTSPVSQPVLAGLGRELFLAQGCVVCHEHNAVREARAELGSFTIGPDLTNFRADPMYLHRWLKDPSSVKPNTEMPTLGLSDDEIEALIAFLNSGKE
ncbi:MAG TPA: c-type cytochrome [Anaerolineae bacterium]